MGKKARIIRYWQVVDETNAAIDNAHSYKQAIEIKKEYEDTQRE